MSGFEHKHLIIGAGFVGLGLARALKRDGIAYDQVDADDDLGGNWYHGVYPHVHIITSKKTTEYPDFPMPEHYPVFPDAGQVLEYLHDYADNFGLKEHIEFNKTVIKAVPTADEKWQVAFADGEERIYKGIMVCNGHHWDERWPSYPGEFTGEYIHSKKYRNAEQLKGKKVLVIGGGNSGCDIAVDAARHAKEAHISLRKGYWFLPKSVLGRPIVEFITPWIPLWLQRILLRLLIWIVVGDYKKYGLQKPTDKIFERHPTVNSLLLYYLREGSVKPHPDIKSWQGREVEFVDGTKDTFDMVVAATGYYVSFPFFPKGLVEVKGAVPQVTMGVFHPLHKGLYLIGWGQPRFGAGPLITAGAPGLCEVIKMQDKMKRPVGVVLRKIGKGIPKTHVMDPIRSLRQAKIAKRQARLLPLLEKIVFRNQTYRPPSVDAYQKQMKKEPAGNYF